MDDEFKFADWLIEGCDLFCTSSRIIFEIVAIVANANYSSTLVQLVLASESTTTHQAIFFNSRRKIDTVNARVERVVSCVSRE